MAYATITEFNERYVTKLTDTEVGSHFLHHAANRLDSMLAGYFTVPLSSNNLTAKDLNIDLAYLLILQRSREPRDYEGLAGMIEQRVKGLRAGTDAMVTDSGDALYRQPVDGEVWSTTQDFKPVFDLRTPEAQRVDPDRIEEEEQTDR